VDLGEHQSAGGLFEKLLGPSQITSGREGLRGIKKPASQQRVLAAGACFSACAPSARWIEIAANWNWNLSVVEFRKGRG
jgi:hypothetical protein